MLPFYKTSQYTLWVISIGHYIPYMKQTEDGAAVEK